MKIAEYVKYAVPETVAVKTGVSRLAGAANKAVWRPGLKVRCISLRGQGPLCSFLGLMIQHLTTLIKNLPLLEFRLCELI